MSTHGEGTRNEPSAGRAGGRGRPGTAGTPPAGQSAQGERSTVGWVALLVAVLLTAWRIGVGLTIEGVAAADRETYSGVGMMVGLILAVGAVVLGLVALSQRHRHPRWPAVVALAVGAHAFLVSVAMWLGELMNA